MSRDSFFRIIPETFPPIFSGMFDDLTLFYAPGYLVAAREKEAAEIRNIIIGEFPFGNLPAGELINAAISAQSGWSIQHDPYCYHPTCLTIYSAAACNLNCIYCFAEKVHAQKMQLSGDLIFSAAEKVLRNCKELQVPFTVVFHGGGEPMQDFNLPDLLLDLNRMADGAQVIFHSYIATNGVMDADRANWMAANFDEIGLSVDGPPEIQNLQRPGKTGVETAAAVERTAGILKKIKGSLSVRATVLPDNFKRIPEIVSYLKNNLDADGIHIEPVYHAGTRAESAEDFCEGFLAAKQIFPTLTFSGSRIREIHGRYCQIFRQVMHLVPPQGLSACFALSTREEAAQLGLDDPENTDTFACLAQEDPECLTCFNRYHCSRGCPDVCPALTDAPRDFGSFRCLISRKLAEAELLDLARRSLSAMARKYGYAGMKLRGES